MSIKHIVTEVEAETDAETEGVFHYSASQEKGGSTNERKRKRKNVPPPFISVFRFFFQGVLV